MNTSPYSTHKKLRWGTIMLLSLPLMLTACAAPIDEESGSQPDTSSNASPEQATDAPSNDQASELETGAGEASLLLVDDSFSFELAFCAIDEADILVHGPGKSEISDEPSYLDVDFVEGLTVGGASVGLGATTLFETADESYSFDAAYFGGEYSLNVDGNSFVLEGEFRGPDGSPVGAGTLAVDCR